VNNKPYRCNNEGIISHCPVTCNGCDTCQDSEARFKLVKDGRRIARNCDWVATKKTAIRCGYEGVAETCRDTCDACTEEDEGRDNNIFE